MIRRSAWVAIAVLGLGATVLGQGHTPQQHAKPTKAMACCSDMKDMKGSTKKSSDACCGGMAKASSQAKSPDHQKMVEMLKTEDEKLTTVLAAMNDAGSDTKLDAAVKAINEIADQHRKTQALMVGYMSAQSFALAQSKPAGCCAH